MATIGTFTCVNDVFNGELETLTVKAKISIAIITKEKEGMPDYRVTAGKSEIGAGWIRKSKGGSEYISIKIDDPVWPAPIYANLIERNGSHKLIWNRKGSTKA
ncbi:DUF736 domain-containing protein [Sneathiella aquimaris]|uniref:DUF736 domain-containing protein n=1 Tax=Sneathiella aquimaris TaxID=2599305 RepID=UPI00146BF000|nr:DUF736 domain-containing protein [Sneathiella aquimaris]